MSVPVSRSRLPFNMRTFFALVLEMAADTPLRQMFGMMDVYRDPMPLHDGAGNRSRFRAPRAIANFGMDFKVIVRFVQTRCVEDAFNR